MRINTRTFVLNISLIALLALCVFSPIYQYQKMILILGSFLIWFVSTTQTGAHWINRMSPSLLYLGAMFILYLWRGIAMGDVSGSVNLIVNQLPLYIWVVILEFYLYSEMPTKTVVIAFFVLFLITTYFTLTGNLVNPGASRQLAGTTLYYEAQREQYRASFIGGYDIIYGAVFLTMPLTLLAKRYKWIWGIIAAFFVMIVVSSYTIAIILMLFMIICGVTRVKNIWTLALVFGGVFLVVMVFQQQILTWVLELSTSIDSEILNRRVSSLLTGEYFGEFGDNSNRLTIFYNTILNWLEHPIFGNLLTSVKESRRTGHSTLLGYLAEFGLFSAVFYAYLKRYYVIVKQSLSTEYGKFFSIYFFYFIIFSLIDRYDTALACCVCVFFIGPILFMMADKMEHGHENTIADKVYTGGKNG